MTFIRNLTLGLLLFACSAAAASAQERADAQTPPPAPAITISNTAEGLRFAALGSVRQTRLEVLGEGGDSLYNSGFRAGSVRDWNLEDDRGQRLPDGAYLCVVSVRDVSGRLFIKQGPVLVQGGRASLQMAEAQQADAAETGKGLAAVAADADAAVTLTAHDGSDGQVVSTRGGLMFRAGDFFAGRDRELMRLTPEGDLGLGVAAPRAKLDVAGVIRARGGIQFDDGTVLTSARGAARVSPWWNISTAAAGETTAAAITGTGTANKLAKWIDNAGTLSDSVLSESGGNLGLGKAPDASIKLDILSPAGVVPFKFLQNVPASNTPTLGAFATSDGTIGQYAASVSGGGITFLMGSTTGKNFGLFANNAYNAPQFFINSNGNVGVGSLSPQAKLDVAGDLRVSGDAVVAGNIAAKYQDVAEWVRSRGPLAAGTVVVLDTGRVDAVVPSRRAYDTHVAGVVSAQPGVLLGQGGEGKVMVATTGRVRVRVNAMGRPVRVGDLLVTSGKSGAAMRSVPVRTGNARLHRPGTIIGKALEPLASGQGEILVLLSLQ